MRRTGRLDRWRRGRFADFAATLPDALPHVSRRTQRRVAALRAELAACAPAQGGGVGLRSQAGVLEAEPATASPAAECVARVLRAARVPPAQAHDEEQTQYGHLLVYFAPR